MNYSDQYMSAQPEKELRSRYQRLSEIVTGQIETWIMDGTLKAGERINAEELGEKLGVSRMPVREAIKSLEQSGLVESIPYQGTKVTTLTLENLKEIYLLRQILESTASFHAAERITEEELIRLEETQFVLERLIDVTGGENKKKIYQLNRDFHEQMYRASHMPRLCEFINILWNNIAYYRLISASNTNYGEKMKREHRSYLEALKARDGEKLSQLIRSSLEQHVQSLPEELQRYYAMVATHSNS
jgi:DNA-binding GntR family transcriptional regulator